MNEIGNTMPKPTFTEKVNEICEIIEQYVDDELARSEQDIKGDYLLQMRENPKLKRTLRG